MQSNAFKNVHKQKAKTSLFYNKLKYSCLLQITVLYIEQYLF